jgi:uncharacterized protein YcbK (DUF882 family)
LRSLARRLRHPRRDRWLLFVCASLGLFATGFVEPPMYGQPRPAWLNPPRTKIRTYADMVRSWHTPPTEEPGLTPEGRPTLVLEMIHTQERIELAPLREDGGFTAEDLALATHALRDPRNDEECDADERVLDIVYQIEIKFHAKAVRVVSAYRGPRYHHSRHGVGRALDLVVPGTRDEEVAKFARSIGFVGVGVYPRSGFVHVDSRSRSYFWVDNSSPGRRGRGVQVLAKLAAASDAKALERGETPPGDGVAERQEGEQTDSPATVSASMGLPFLRRHGSDE